MIRSSTAKAPLNFCRILHGQEMEEEMNEGGRSIKLFCPAIPRLMEWIVWDEQKLDLGSIARALGLDPSTVKLNGYYVSRDSDFFSHCVTWRSLLSFFSVKGMPTGSDDRDALLVDGKFCKVDAKRFHDLDDLDRAQSKPEPTYDAGSRNRLVKDIDSLKSRRLMEECDSGELLVSRPSEVGFKRKLMHDEIGSFKKLHIGILSSS